MYYRFGSLFYKINECITDLVDFCIQKASEGSYGMIRDGMVRYGVVRYDAMRYGTVWIRYVCGLCTVRAQYARGTVRVR